MHHTSNIQKFRISKKIKKFNLIIPVGSATVGEMKLLALSENAQHGIEECVTAENGEPHVDA